MNISIASATPIERVDKGIFRRHNRYLYRCGCGFEGSYYDMITHRFSRHGDDYSDSQGALRTAQKNYASVAQLD